MSGLVLERTLQSSCFEFVGVSIPGQKRTKNGDESEDYFTCELGENWIVAVVSDGAGSALRGKEGAILISDSICKMLSRNLTNNTSQPLVCWIGEQLDCCISQARDECSSLGALSDFHATLVGIAARKTEVVFFHIGDGAISAHSVDDSQLVTAGFSLPENGEYSNQTYFFTSNDWRSHLRIQHFESIKATFWLMSDGMHMLSTDNPAAPTLRESTVVEFDRLFKKYSTIEKTELLRSILTSPPALKESDGDDITLVIVKQRGQQDGKFGGL